MNLLVSWMGDLGVYVSREFYYTMQDLIHVHGWKHAEPWMLSGRTSDPKPRLRELIGGIPDVVLFWEAYDLFHAIQPALRDVGCRVALYADDLHMMWGHESKREMKLRAFDECDVLLTPYAYVLHDFFPELIGRKEAIWSPHSASPDFALPFNQTPESTILLSGAIGPLYPLRMRMRELYQQRRYAIVHHVHPGYLAVYDYRTDPRVGTGYAKTIRQHLAAFTDALTFRYIVAKYFEIPATGTLLVADEAVSDPLRDLGFQQNTHYVGVSAEDLETKLEYVLDARNRDEIDAIRRRGQDLVRGAHRTCDRARRIHESCVLCKAVT